MATSASWTCELLDRASAAIVHLPISQEPILVPLESLAHRCGDFCLRPRSTPDARVRYAPFPIAISAVAFRANRPLAPADTHGPHRGGLLADQGAVFIQAPRRTVEDTCEVDPRSEVARVDLRPSHECGVVVGGPSADLVLHREEVGAQEHLGDPVVAVRKDVAVWHPSLPGARVALNAHACLERDCADHLKLLGVASAHVRRAAVKLHHTRPSPPGEVIHLVPVASPNRPQSCRPKSREGLRFAGKEKRRKWRQNQAYVTEQWRRAEFMANVEEPAQVSPIAAQTSRALRSLSVTAGHGRLRALPTVSRVAQCVTGLAASLWRRRAGGA